MRYQFLASALAAQLALTSAMPQPDQTVYETEVDTITSCGPEVTNCPARSHPATAAPSGPAATTAAVPSESVPAYGVPSAPAESAPGSSAPSAPAYGVPSGPAPSAPASSGVEGSHPDGPQTVYTTNVQTITSCGPEVTNCPASSTHPATGVPSSPAPSGTGKTCEEQENMCRTKPGANMATCSADRYACDGYIPGQSSGTASAPVPSGTASGGKTCEEQENMCRTQPGANQATCSADRYACDGYIPGQSSGTASAPAPSGTASGGQTCEEQENMCRTKPGANQATCSADRYACDGYIPGQSSGTASAPAPSGTASGGKTCEEQENMCRTQPGANMATCSADRYACDGYLPGQGSGTPSNATASLATPTPAQPTPSQWTGAASTSFVSFGVMALAAAAAAFVL
ncbi:extracellular serine-threonine rich protein [Diplodia corticola]|uniref:Extracellular serine-threonine rich protein n=1 Tax=Diplodia corticola TaxID=236234 RepID=A0A1J9QWJ3_9PEZI|nr:extracellular serine-threonine rich protein [Diplodia corticola]OJD33358.1 extracellular serine-threonine rich protein [Diplodia corticola]